MNQLTIKFKKLKPEAILPEYATENDAGFDLFSLEDYQLKPGERKVFGIGLAAEIPVGFFVIIKPKSGLAVKGGIDVLAGVIDSGYRGEWGVVLVNLSNQPYQFHKGDKIAQGVLLPVANADIKKVDSLSDSERGAGAFGSTGK